MFYFCERCCVQNVYNFIEFLVCLCGLCVATENEQTAGEDGDGTYIRFNTSGIIVLWQMCSWKCVAYDTCLCGCVSASVLI